MSPATPLYSGPIITRPLSVSPVQALRNAHGGGMIPVTANLKSWLRSDLNLTLATGVSSWGDLSGNAINATQGTGSAQPTLVVDAIGGWPALRFTATGSQCLAIDGLAASVTGTDVAHSVVMALKLADVAGTRTFFSAGNAANAVVLAVYRTATTAFGLLRRDDANSLLSDSVTAADILPHVVTVVFSGTQGLLYIDGTLRLTAGLDVGACTFDKVAIGAQVQNALSQFWNGDIAEFAFYTGALSNADRLSVERYMGTRYGILTA